MESQFEDLEKKIIDELLPKESQAFLTEYFINGLFGENKNFTKGLNYSDYDILLSTFEAEESEIFHILNISNTKFDPETAPSRKVIVYEDLKEIMEPHVNRRNLAEKYFHRVTLHAFPKIKRNLRFDITSLNYKIVKNGIVRDYKMDHNQKNPDNKDILCLCTFKLDGFEHKFSKQLKIIKEISEKKEFWNYHRIIYIILCIKEENKIIEEYKMLPEELKTANEKYNNIRVLFYINPPGGDDKEIINMFAFTDFLDLVKSYYFFMNSNHVVYRVDDMHRYQEIITNSIKRKKREKEENNIKTKAQIRKEKLESFITFYHFIDDLRHYKYKYNLNLTYEFEVCLRFDGKGFSINYIDVFDVGGELRTKEYNIVKNCAEVLNTYHFELEEIPTIDIDIDFSNKECHKCSKIFKDNEDMYYCYKCKTKYCSKCVSQNFKINKGKAKFIDSKHNILYFKTRDLNQFKNIDKYKLGNDLFAQCTDEKKLGEHSNIICKGCDHRLENSPRYICLHCKPGKVVDEGFYDYCDKCVEHMMKKDLRGIEIQKKKEKIYSDENRMLYKSNETISHDNESHIYIMIAMEYNHNKNDY